MYTSEAATQRCHPKKRCSENMQKIYRRTPMPKARNFIKKKTLEQMVSCEFCKISKNIFLTEHTWTTAFTNSAKENPEY